jgi:hypothetical protein
MQSLVASAAAFLRAYMWYTTEHQDETDVAAASAGRVSYDGHVVHVFPAISTTHFASSS